MNHFKLPFYLREELSFEDASCLECLRDLPSEQEASLGHIYEDIAHNFSEVHATAHFLVSARHTQAQQTHLKRHPAESGHIKCMFPKAHVQEDEGIFRISFF